jgi:RNA-splicing ligase RtcB
MKRNCKTLAQKGIIIKSPSYRGIAEEAPGAYKDVNAVVDATERAPVWLKTLQSWRL